MKDYFKYDYNFMLSSSQVSVDRITTKFHRTDWDCGVTFRLLLLLDGVPIGSVERVLTYRNIAGLQGSDPDYELQIRAEMKTGFLTPLLPPILPMGPIPKGTQIQ